MTGSAGRPPTMQDVARAAGVSRAAVSIAFRGVPGVSDKTRARVLETAASLGYVRDENARGLRTDQSTSIGVCFQTRQAFQLEVVDAMYGMLATGDESGHQLVLSGASRVRGEDEAVADLIAHRSGVLVLISPQMSEMRLVEFSRRAPLISVGRRIRASEVVWVASDDQGGMNAAVNHLVELEHHDILYLSSTAAPAGRARLRAFERAAAAAGIADDVRIGRGGWTESAGVEAAEEMLADGHLPTAVIGFNDRCALGMIEVLLRHGVDVPGDVSIVGFDDSEIAARRPILMTSIRQDPAQMARIAMERAQSLLRVPRHAVSHGTLVPTSLTIRTTTGPAAKR